MRCFKEFQAWLERATEKLVKRVHSDQAQEYKALGGYLRDQGIEQSFSTAYTPQSNGLAERYNRTLLDKVRSMLTDSGLDMKFWGEATIYATHLCNVTATKVNGGQTPYEVLFGKKPNVSKLRIFGCAAYMHMTKERRPWKLAARSMPGVFIGLENGLYRVWNLQKNEVFASKHVLVDETKFSGKVGRALQGDCGHFHDEDGEAVIDFQSLLPLDEDGTDDASKAIETPEVEDSEPKSAQFEGKAAYSQPISANEGDATKEAQTDGRRYFQRARTAPRRFGFASVAAFAARRGSDADVPTLREALESKEADNWKAAIQDEVKALEGTGTW